MSQLPELTQSNAIVLAPSRLNQASSSSDPGAGVGINDFASPSNDPSGSADMDQVHVEDSASPPAKLMTTEELREMYQTRDYVVRVHVVRGRQLVPKDSNGKSDPYLVFRIGRSREPGGLQCFFIFVFHFQLNRHVWT